MWVFLIVVMQKKSQVTDKCNKAVTVGTATEPGTAECCRRGGVAVL